LKADPRFLAQSKEFWANVRTISQEVGYTERGTRTIKIPSLETIREEFGRLGLGTAHIADMDSTFCSLTITLRGGSAGARTCAA
jgi:hypothetical protein